MRNSFGKKTLINHQRWNGRVPAFEHMECGFEFRSDIFMACHGVGSHSVAIASWDLINLVFKKLSGTDNKDLHNLKKIIEEAMSNTPPDILKISNQNEELLIAVIHYLR